jgi:hypothetical protein
VSRPGGVRVGERGGEALAAEHHADRLLRRQRWRPKSMYNGQEPPLWLVVEGGPATSAGDEWSATDQRPSRCRSRVSVLKATVIARSLVDPRAGSMPIWRANPAPS